MNGLKNSLLLKALAPMARRGTKIAVVACAIFVFTNVLVACDNDWLKSLEFGDRVPDARLMVTLPEPATKYELYQRFTQVAANAGFLFRKGREISDEDIKTDNLPNTYWMFRNQHSTRSEIYVGFGLPRNVARPSTFTFIFYNSSTEKFGEEEWVAFFQWKNQFLPAGFPEGEVTVTKHPAVMTDPKQVDDISAKTGILVPNDD